jgi:cytochrome b pre-mRNA-processing protein 3
MQTEFVCATTGKMPMFKWLGKQSDSTRIARALYGAVVTQARNLEFYSDLGVADTVEGRYELVALHLILALERLGQPEMGSEDVRRETLETFVTDMEDAMREMGVGDTSVPKKVKRAAGGVYARNEVYQTALAAAGDQALQAALVEYVYQGGECSSAPALAAYVRRAAAHLAALDAKTLLAGHMTFPQPKASP